MAAVVCVAGQGGAQTAPERDPERPFGSAGERLVRELETRPRGLQTRSFERTVEGGKDSVRVTLTASPSTDPRVLDYLQETLRIVAPRDFGRREVWNLRTLGELDEEASEIAVAVTPLRPGDPVV
jgi:hypothetical protein